MQKLQIFQNVHLQFCHFLVNLTGLLLMLPFALEGNIIVIHQHREVDVEQVLAGNIEQLKTFVDRVFVFGSADFSCM